MARRAAKFVSAMVAGILTGAPLSAPREAAHAADCLSQPGQDAPKGQHWHYRLERGTKRHCWYLRDESDKAAHITPSDAPASSTAAPASEPARLPEDAHAEFPAPLPQPPVDQTPATTVIAPSPTPPATSPSSVQPQDSTGSSAVASRWPATSELASSAAPPVATEEAAPETNQQDTSAAATTPAVPAVAETATGRPSASLLMLLAAIAGALAVAGLIASIILRLGRSRRVRADTQRRAAIWDRADAASGPETMPPWAEPAAQPSTPGHAEFRGSYGPSGATQERYQKIEEILAQLVKQGQQSDTDSEALSDRHVPS